MYYREMKMQHNHLLQRLTGEEQSRMLIGCLNGDPRNPHRKRLFQMLQRISELSKTSPRQKDGPSEEKLPEGVRFVSSQEFSRRVGEVRKDFDRYLPRMTLGGVSYSLYKGKVEYKEGLCPVTEKVQPTIMQFVNNYGSLEDAQPKVDALRKAIEAVQGEKK